MPGPAKKDTSKYIQLPAEGRTDPPPKWPLSKALPGELPLWRYLWSTPQAVMWERLHASRNVARFVRLAVQAEVPEASTRLLAEARQMEHDLGLTPMGLHRLGWSITHDELAEQRKAGPRRLSAAERLAAANAS